MRLDHGIGWSLNGFDISGTDPEGVRWLTRDVKRWDSPPGSTGAVTQNQFADGAWIGPAYLQSKPMVIEGRAIVLGRPLRESRSLIKAALADFNAAIPVRDLAPLALSDFGDVYHRLIRQEGDPDVRLVSDYELTFSVQVVAPKSRKLGGDGSTPYQHQQTVHLPSSAGGFQLPAVAPFSIDAVVVNGAVAIHGRGTAAPPVLVRVHGPAVRPVIREQDGGVMLLDISLDTGHWLDVNLDARTIKINSTVSRRNALQGRWITPRAGLVLSLDAAVYDPQTSMTVFWTDASY